MRMVNIMNYKMLIYVFCVLISVFVVSGMNLNPIFKKNHMWEERIFIIMLSMIMGYLAANFLFDFINVSSII